MFLSIWIFSSSSKAKAKHDCPLSDLTSSLNSIFRTYTSIDFKKPNSDINLFYNINRKGVIVKMSSSLNELENQIYLYSNLFRNKTLPRISAVANFRSDDFITAKNEEESNRIEKLYNSVTVNCQFFEYNLSFLA